MLRLFRILDEGEDPCCSWSICQIILVTSTLSVSLMNGNVVAEIQVLNRVSGHEMRIKRVEKVGLKEDGAFIKKVTEEANLLPDVEDKLGKSVLFMSTLI